MANFSGMSSITAVRDARGRLTDAVEALNTANGNIRDMFGVAINGGFMGDELTRAMEGVSEAIKDKINGLNNLLDGSSESFGAALAQYIKNYEDSRRESAAGFSSINVE